MKILKFSPIKREQGRNTCHCYKETNIYGGSKMPISFTVDPDTKAKDYDRARKQTLRCYEIGTKFRPYKRVLKTLQEHMGRKNDMMPICPHCREKIDLEKLANGVWIRKVEK